MTHIKRIVSRIMAWTLATLMILTMIPVNVFADEKSEKAVYHITSTEEFMRFVENCRIDSWSVGRTVSIDEDISLFGTGFTGIASFSGTLEGNNHTITDVWMSNGGETVGLFRYLETTALIKNLTVSGNISSTNSADIIGGIVGINLGIIDRCTFKGSIRTSGITGGVAGYNGQSGSIRNCVNVATITSDKNVGGIVGQNWGSVSDCSNRGNINSDSSWVDGAGDSNETNIDVRDTLQSGMNVGGVAGINCGVLATCSNYGIVGYLRSGENIGGIAGYHSGSIVSCINNGKVYGKQEVGGIAGHVQPYVVPEDVEELKTQVDNLHDNINTMVDDIDSMTDTIHSDMDMLVNHADKAAAAAGNVSEELVDVTTVNIDAVNDLSDRADYISNHLPAVLDNFAQALKNLKKVNEDLAKVKDDLDIDDKMEETPYDASAQERLILLSGVGGNLETNNSSPAEGVSVRISVTPSEGYVLKNLTKKTYGGVSEDVTAYVADGEYVFVMPEENITITALFDFEGDYIASSNEGGVVSLAKSSTNLKVRIVENAGYHVQKTSSDEALVMIGSNEVNLGVKNSDGYYEAEVARADYPTIGKITLVNAEFIKDASVHTVVTHSSTGGIVTVNKPSASSGETVTLTVNSMTNYTVDSLNAYAGLSPIGVAKSGEKTYTFTMPDDDVSVDTTFIYSPESDTKLYTMSTTGGSVTAMAIPNTNDYRITLTPESGYEVAQSGTVLQIFEGNTQTLKKELSCSDLDESGNTYRYTLTSTNYVDPIKVYGLFSKRSGADYAVRVSGGTGGVVTANKTTVKAGDELVIAIANDLHYRLKKLSVDGMEMTSSVANGTCAYTVPATQADNLMITAQFEPTTFILTSKNAAGKASYSVQDGEITLKVEPGTGYAVETPVVKDGNGDLISIQKQYANAEMYKFGADYEGTAVCELSFTQLNDKETVHDAKDRISENSDLLTEAVDKGAVIKDDINAILTDEFGEPKSPEDLTEDELEQLEQDALDLMDEISKGSVAAAQIVKDLNTITTVMDPYIQEALDALDTDLDQTLTDMDSMITNMQDATAGLQTIVDYINSLKKLQLKNFSPEFKANVNLLNDEIGAIVDCLNAMNGHFSAKTDVLENDLRKVNDQLTKVLDMMLDRISAMEDMAGGDDIFVDKSKDDPKNTNATLISGSKNFGMIDGTSSIGGIAGAVEPSEINKISDTEVRFGSKYAVYATLTGNKNQGVITIKNTNGGAIAGKVSMGYLEDCLAAGCVKSEEGSYIGGIAGSSKGTIKNCYSLSQLCGKEYIGGIAGAAEEIHNCLSMATITSGENRMGAIMGSDMRGDENDLTIHSLSRSKRISENYYVSSSLYGIDEISYIGVAEPLLYTQMVEREECPHEFRHLMVSFIDENGVVLKKTEVPYGENLATLEYPQIQSEDGNYIEWTKKPTDKMESNMTVWASSAADVTILASEEKSGGKPLALAEGTFTEDGVLFVWQSQVDVPENLPENAKIHCITVSFGNTGLTEESETQIRLLVNESGKTQIFALRDNLWKEVPTSENGHYRELTMHGIDETFCVVTVPEKDNLLLYTAAAGGSAVLMITAVVIHMVARKKRKGNGVSVETGD